ncbi:MAG: hypothetical protein M1829_004057 [Trizodia sp. TS-e1964]|nr:MAG: hypothetical protein M1829_004057 [Trizodia sp. TS-e1964]
MRFSTLVPLALAAAPALVSATGSLGFAIGDKKADGSCKYTDDYAADFDAIKAKTSSTTVRIYAANDCNCAQQILPAAKSKGFKVILGVWPDTDESFKADTDALKQYVPQYTDQVYAITVGSESLYRGNFTGDQLAGKVSSVKQLFPNIKVGTADSWNKYADGTANAVVKASDIVLVNAFAYWQGQDIKNATHTFLDDIQQALGVIQTAKSSIEFWVGETGWPTEGSNYEAAVPSISNAETFWKEGVCAALAWSINVFYFEVFDEPWKPVSIGQNGQAAPEKSWGAMTSDRVPKFQLKSPRPPSDLLSVPPSSTTSDSSNAPPPLPYTPEARKTGRYARSHSLSPTPLPTVEVGADNCITSHPSIPADPSHAFFWDSPGPPRSLSSSPQLPPLPILPIVGGLLPDHSDSPSAYQRSDSSLYYTASWGSPYQRYASLSVADSLKHDRSNSSDFEDSSIRRLTFDNSPIPHSSRRQESISSVLNFSPKSPIRGLETAQAPGFRGDWIQNYLSGQKTNSEKENWWSDDSADESDKWFDVEDEFKLEDPKTPTLTDFAKEPSAVKGVKRHKSKKSNETLKPEDFWDLFHSPSSSPNHRNMYASIYAPAQREELPGQAETPVSRVLAKSPIPIPKSPSPPLLEKPLPLPPSESAPEKPSTLETSPKMIPKKALSPIQPERLKKKVPWQSKTVTIHLPPQSYREFAPLSPAEVESRLKKWEHDGFDTRGFGYWGSREILDGGEGEGQSRRIFPDQAEVLLERSQNPYRVYIPDPRDWEAYVNYLKEEKLRALGVSIGDDPPASTMSPTPSMGRQHSSQYPPLPFSPPIPTSSAASNLTGQIMNTLSPVYLPSTTPSSQVASPGSSHPHMHSSFHGQRGSISYPMGEQSFFQYPQNQMTPPIHGMWSPHQLVAAQGMPRGGSPAVAGNIQNLNSVMSPPSPYTPEGHLAQAAWQQQLLQNQSQLFQQQQHLMARQSPRLHEVREVEEEAEEANTVGERVLLNNRPLSRDQDPSIATPMPRGHRHNLSESLQREIDEAENQLEEALERQTQEEKFDTNPHSPVSPLDSLDKDLPSFTEQELPSPDSQIEPAEEAPKSLSEVEQPGEPQSHTKTLPEILDSLPPLPSDDEEFASHDKEMADISPRLVALPSVEDELVQLNEDISLPRPQLHSRAPSETKSPYHSTTEADDLAAQASPSAGKELRDLDGELSDDSKTNDFEIITNPSAPLSPAPLISTTATSEHRASMSNSSNPWPTPEKATSASVSTPVVAKAPTHTSKISTSKLNVEAAEFKFNPKSAFSPAGFSFSGSNFQPNVSTSSRASPPLEVRPNNVPDLRKPSTAMRSTWNIAAAPFKPGAAAFPTGTGNFNFSSKVSSFTPGAAGAASFQPGGLNNTENKNNQIGSIPEAGARPAKIFSFDAVEIVKPAPQSKAVPIVKPKEIPAGDVEEDDEGRITLSEGRLKRQRHANNDGDQVPLFAVASHPLTEPIIVPLELKEIPTTLDGTSTDKENEFPEEGTKDKLPTEKPTTQISARTTRQSMLDESPDYDGRSYGNQWGRYEFNAMDDVQAFNTARPSSPHHRTISHFPLYEPSADSDEEMQELSAEQAQLAASAVLAAERKELERLELQKALDALSNDTSMSVTAKESDVGTTDFKFEDHLTLQPKSLPEFQGHISTSPSPTVPESNAVAILKQKQIITSNADIPEPQKHVIYPEDRDNDFSTLVEPSFEEIDAHFQNDSDYGVERTEDPWRREGLHQLPPARLDDVLAGQSLKPAPSHRSDAPSPSPRRFQAPSLQQFRDWSDPPQIGGSISPEEDVFARANVAYGSPVHRLNDPRDIPIETWDDVLLPEDEAKFKARSNFFDTHVNDLVDGLLQQRLDPMEKALEFIQDSIAQMSMNRRDHRSTSAEILNSDADDEDDEEEVARPSSKSPRRNRKLEQLKSAMFETLAAHQSLNTDPITSADLTDLHDALLGMQATIVDRPLTQIEPSVIKGIVEEALASQLMATNAPTARSMQLQPNDESLARIAALENALSESNLRLADETRQRQELEGSLSENKRLLKLAEEGEVKQKGFAQETERKLRAVDDKRHQTLLSTQMRTALLEGAQENLQKTANDLTTKNAMLEASLRAAHAAADKSRDRAERVEVENEKLNQTVWAFKNQMEESMRVREGLRSKFDRLQQDMALASRSIALEKSTWYQRYEEQKIQHEVLSARLDAEGRTRERLELEIVRLEGQEREMMKSRIQAEQIRNANARMEQLVNDIRVENIKQEKIAAQSARDLADAKARHEMELIETRESARAELQRVEALLAAKAEAAYQQIETIQANMESQDAKARSQLESARVEAEAVKSKHNAFVAELTESFNIKLQQQQQKHEKDISELKAQYERAIRNLAEDKERSENNSAERMSLSHAKNDLLQDRMAHMEEKLEIAKQAAQAAVQAAQVAAKSAHKSAETGALQLPEKTSPQALRESIMVLQEQLQERERSIEKLENDLSSVDLEAPSKIKDRDAEITWLRELLGVRISDLQDIINTLSHSHFDPVAARDAAIRLKANLQMEQQERERTTTAATATGPASFPSLASMSSAFASPKAILPFQAAWGNWRSKGRDASLSISTVSDPRTTPSKPPAPTPNFLSGLLTPPTTTATIASARHQHQPPRLSARQAEKLPRHVPSTPPLMRKASYDTDAAGFFDDDDSTAGSLLGEREREREREVDRGLDREHEHDGPFGPVIHSFPT